MARSPTGYIPGIDGLRALAVLAVIAFHSSAELLPGGFAGVDIFFVISGYVISASLAREASPAFVPFVMAFYARRVIRIYPALIACLVVTGMLQVLFVPASWLSTTSSKTGVLAFFGLSNFALTWFNDGYFAPRVEFNAFTHTWSLAVEEQFYLLFPAIFFLSSRWRGRPGVRGFLGSYGLALLLGLSLAQAWYATSHAPDHAFYHLPSRFWELACGALLFGFHARGGLLASSAKNANALIALGFTLMGIAFAFTDQKLFPFPWAIVPVIGTMLVIAGVAPDSLSKVSLRRLLEHPVVVYVGKLSYSLYLWHWPVFVLFRWTVGLAAPLPTGAAILLTALAAIVSYHLLEAPTRRSLAIRLQPDWHVVVGGATLVTCAALLTLTLFMQQPTLSLSVTRDREVWYSTDERPEGRAAPKRMLEGRTMFVVGDSHAGAYNTMLGRLRDEQGAAVRQFMTGGCATAGLLRAESARCLKVNEEVLGRIRAAAASGDIVFLASLRMNRLGNQWGAFDESKVVAEQQSARAAAERKAALREASEIVRGLEERSLIVMIDAPKPIFRAPPFRCADWFNSRNPVCAGGFSMDRQFLSEHRAPVMASLEELQTIHPRLVIWDPFPILCPTETCSSFDGDKPLFFDGDHLSAHGNQVLYPFFVSTVASAWR